MRYTTDKTKRMTKAGINEMKTKTYWTRLVSEDKKEKNPIQSDSVLTVLQPAPEHSAAELCIE